jgi:hypothetical protein
MHQIEYECEDCKKRMSVFIMSCQNCQSKNVKDLTHEELEKDHDHELGKWKSKFLEQGEKIESLREALEEAKKTGEALMAAWANDGEGYEKELVVAMLSGIDRALSGGKEDK